MHGYFINKEKNHSGGHGGISGKNESGCGEGDGGSDSEVCGVVAVADDKVVLAIVVVVAMIAVVTYNITKLQFPRMILH